MQVTQGLTWPRSTISRNSVPGCRRVMNVSRCLRGARDTVTKTDLRIGGARPGWH
jgi:hypothetical protein